MEATPQLQVIIVSGPDDPRKAILGLSMAASAASVGTCVYVYLVMDGARCLLTENCSRPLLDGYPTVSELIEVVHGAGGTIGYCPNCLDEQCSPILQHKTAIQAFCHLAHPGGVSLVGIRMSTIPTVVF